MIGKSLVAAAVVSSAMFCGGTASAQMYYNGYNIGPNYEAMLANTLRQQQAMNQQMQQRTQAIVYQAMQNPDCQDKYRQFLAQGGQMPFPQFAYQYVATGGMTREGAMRFQQNENRNRQAEMNTLAGVRQAEQERGNAQMEGQEHFSHNQSVAGEVLEGRSPWVDPTTGMTQNLAYVGQNGATDPRTGNFYARDDAGNYHVRTPDGTWYDMAPGR